jgi:hypothetical protein
MKRCYLLVVVGCLIPTFAYAAQYESLGEAFVVGFMSMAIFMIGAVIVKFFWKQVKKIGDNTNNESKPLENTFETSDGKGNNDSTKVNSPINTVSNDSFSSLKSELLQKCNPSNYMHPYDHDKVEKANRIYADTLKCNEENSSLLNVLRTQAINELGIAISTKDIYDELCKICNPGRFTTSENYNSEKLSIANDLFYKILRNKNNIEELEIILAEARDHGLMEPSASKEIGSIQVSRDNLSPWNKFKSRQCAKALEIEEITGENFSNVTDKDIVEIEALFDRWSKNAQCTIPQLKDVCINGFLSRFSSSELPEVIEQVRLRIQEECKRYGVVPQHTISFYMIKWLEEYMKGNINIKLVKITEQELRKKLQDLYESEIKRIKSMYESASDSFVGKIFVDTALTKFQSDIRTMFAAFANDNEYNFDDIVEEEKNKALQRLSLYENEDNS